MLLERITDPFSDVFGSQRGHNRKPYETLVGHSPKMTFCDKEGRDIGYLHFTPREEDMALEDEFMWLGGSKSAGTKCIVSLKQWHKDPALTFYDLPESLGNTQGKMRLFDLAGARDEMQLVIGANLVALEEGVVAFVGRSGDSYLLTREELIDGGMYGLWQRYREFCF